jgi:hypothetical protein
VSRKVKSITIDGRGDVTVKEITPWAVFQALNAEDKKTELLTLLEDAVDKPWDEIKTWYPSEQEALLDGLMEVNGSFLSIAGKLKVDGLVKKIAEAMQNDLPELFAGLYKQAMAKVPGVTAGASS